jgi:predicted O-methyltransferase YrrM
MSTETLNLEPQLYDYLLRVSLREPEILRALRQETKNLAEKGMQICPEQGQFMRLLIELIGAKKTLEIGTFTGYSALAVALALPANGKVIACDINAEWTDIAKRYWHKAGVENKINLHLAPALETLQSFIQQGEANTFDFIFIDADKSNYAAYYEKSLTLLRPGGLIAIDNVLWDGYVANPSVTDESTCAIRAINDMIHKDERVTISLLPIGDGLTLARKR